MLKRLVLLSVFAVLAAPAFAGKPSEVVRYFYENPGAESELENRDQFTGSALDFLNAADAVWVRDETDCIEFGFAMDAQDLDEAEIARTLKLDEMVEGDAARVVAQFDNFGQSTEVEWMLSQSAVGWQVSDIVSETNDWRVSAMSYE